MVVVWDSGYGALNGSAQGVRKIERGLRFGFERLAFAMGFWDLEFRFWVLKCAASSPVALGILIEMVLAD